jgi:hypothetical protein
MRFRIEETYVRGGGGYGGVARGRANTCGSLIDAINAHVLEGSMTMYASHGENESRKDRGTDHCVESSEGVVTCRRQKAGQGIYRRAYAL